MHPFLHSKKPSERFYQPARVRLYEVQEPRVMRVQHLMGIMGRPRQALQVALLLQRTEPIMVSLQPQEYREAEATLAALAAITGLPRACLGPSRLNPRCRKVTLQVVLFLQRTEPIMASLQPQESRVAEATLLALAATTGLPLPRACLEPSRLNPKRRKASLCRSKHSELTPARRAGDPQRAR